MLKRDPVQMPLSFDGESPPINEIDERYREWKAKHPEVYRLFVRFALELASQGRRFGMKAIAERVRWEVRTTWNHGQDWKINNVFVAYLARDLIREYSHLTQFIELRRVKGEEECSTIRVFNDTRRSTNVNYPTLKRGVCK